MCNSYIQFPEAIISLSVRIECRINIIDQNKWHPCPLHWLYGDTPIPSHSCWWNPIYSSGEILMLALMSHAWLNCWVVSATDPAPSGPQWPPVAPDNPMGRCLRFQGPNLKQLTARDRFWEDVPTAAWFDLQTIEVSLLVLALKYVTEGRRLQKNIPHICIVGYTWSHLSRCKSRPFIAG